VAQFDFDPSSLLDALRAGEDVDLIRSSVELVLQGLIDAEATAFIGAAPHERSDERTNYRNGHRARLLTTKAGDVELKIPKLWQGSFFPQILERRRRVDKALYAVVMEAYVHGVSTRKVDDLVQALRMRQPSLSPRCRGSARSSTTRWRASGCAGSTTSPSLICSATPPT